MALIGDGEEGEEKDNVEIKKRGALENKVFK